ncbi:MAG: enoyl-CoA hydratase/isomerase family protein [Acidobacteriales bacterium]|nr:enoyl-CoA hydratase/isomerase family protein [Terriglobales bacterium]
MNRIRIESAAGVAHITLAHPPVNVIDIPMMEELLAAIREAEQKPEIRAIVFRGEDKHFSAGVDIAAHAPETVAEMLTKFHAVILAVADSPKVTVAVVHGNCLGGGAELALVCDMVFTTGGAIWGFPEIRLACFPPVACVALAALVGQKQAAELILSGRTFSGYDAREMGLANDVAETEVNAELALDRALKPLAELSPAALAVTKRAMYVWQGLHLDKGLARAEKIYLEELMKTEDVKEGVAAWREKRPPKWKGK